ncbi:MAG: hypothetical protein JRM82_03025 [Nitrososphaerota archaeon]|nr:hypothetical protein [Nitrososphaerota archaeon]
MRGRGLISAFPSSSTDVALLIDKSDSVQRVLRGRMIGTGFGTVHSSRLVAAIIFLSMGVVTVLLGVMNRMLPTPGSEFFNIYETVIQGMVEAALSSPAFQAVFAGAVILGAGLCLRRRLLLRRKETRNE